MAYITHQNISFVNKQGHLFRNLFRNHQFPAYKSIIGIVFTALSKPHKKS